MRKANLILVIFAAVAFVYAQDIQLPPQKGIHYFIIGSSGQLCEGNIGKTELTVKGFDQDNVFMLAEIVGDDMFFQVISRTGKTVDLGSIKRAEKSAKVSTSR